jgi:hypothetical protein
MKYTFNALRLFFEVLPFRKSRVVPRHVGAPERLIIWSRLNPILLKLVWHGTGLQRAQTTNNFRRNSFACGDLGFLAPHFGVVQWSFSAQSNCLARPPLCPAPNRCNAVGTILSSQNNKQWHKTHALYTTSDCAMCTYVPLLNLQATSKLTTWND